MPPLLARFLTMVAKARLSDEYTTSRQYSLQRAVRHSERQNAVREMSRMPVQNSLPHGCYISVKLHKGYVFCQVLESNC